MGTLLLSEVPMTYRKGDTSKFNEMTWIETYLDWSKTTSTSLIDKNLRLQFFKVFVIYAAGLYQNFIKELDDRLQYNKIITLNLVSTKSCTLINGLQISFCNERPNCINWISIPREDMWLNTRSGNLPKGVFRTQSNICDEENSWRLLVNSNSTH